MFTNGKTYIIFYSSGAHFLFFLLFLSHFRFFCLSFLLPFLCSLSLPLLDVSASLSNETQAGASSQVDLYCSGLFFFIFCFFFYFFYFFIFLVCDLMLNSAVVVWVMDLAFWVVVWCASTILWIWVHGFGFAGLCSWIIDVIGVDRRLDRSHRRWSLRGRERERRRKK